MKDIIEILERWTAEGAAVALGTVDRARSAPPRAIRARRSPSRRTGEVAGGVTGGCVEPAVIREANEVLDGSPRRLVHYGLDDEDGFDVGLTCGGKIAVAVYALDPELVPPIAEAVRDGPPDRRHASGSTRSGSASRRSSPATARANGDALDRGPVAARARRERDRRDRRRRAGLRRVVRAAPEPVSLRRERPRRGARADRASRSATASRSAIRAGCSSPSERFPDADELSDEWPDQFLERAPVDRAHGDLHDDARPEVRRAGAQDRAGVERRVHRRDGQRRRSAPNATRACASWGSARPTWRGCTRRSGIQIGARTPEEVAVTIAAQLIEANVVARSQRAYEGSTRGTVLA